MTWRYALFTVAVAGSFDLPGDPRDRPECRGLTLFHCQGRVCAAVLPGRFTGSPAQLALML
jgi:hypothetical protein